MLQFISHYNSRYDYVSGIETALEGGCRWVQLRMKSASDSEVADTGRIAGDMCRRHGAVFIVDDRVHLVDTLGADGVHVGKNDMPVAEARRILGPDKIIGATANTFADIRDAAAAGADYIGLGPFRFTTTKQKLSPMLGLDGYARIMKQCSDEGIGVPIVAIGGILASDVPALMATGIAGIAMSGALLNADNPADETRQIMKLINNNKIYQR